MAKRIVGVILWSLISSLSAAEHYYATVTQTDDRDVLNAKITTPEDVNQIIEAINISFQPTGTTKALGDITVASLKDRAIAREKRADAQQKIELSKTKQGAERKVLEDEANTLLAEAKVLDPLTKQVIVSGKAVNRDALNRLNDVLKASYTNVVDLTGLAAQLSDKANTSFKERWMKGSA